MGRGSSKAGGKTGRASGGGGLNPANIKNTQDMVSARANYQEAVDDVLTVSRAMVDEYGEDNVIGQFVISEIGGRDAGTLGYYGANTIGLNEMFMNREAMNGAYDDSVATGYHPSRGNRTGIEAVAAHEYGHALTDRVGQAMGVNNIDEAATRIVNEARRNTGHRGVVQMARNISEYATASNAEAVAEAFADVYCNGSRARRESRAIVDVCNGYLKS